MELAVALGTYVGVFIAAFLLLMWFRYKFFASLLLALIVGLIYINIAFPMTRDELEEVNALTVLYSFIQIFTLVVIVIFTIFRLLQQRRSNAKFPVVNA